MPKGNPNPNTSGLKPFPKGKSGNPGGKTAEQVAIERRNADTAMRIREKLLAAAERKLAAIGDDDAALELIEAAMLKLIKDAEDRGLGAPTQPLQHTGADGGPVKFAKAEELTDEQLAAIAAGQA